MEEKETEIVKEETIEETVNNVQEPEVNVVKEPEVKETPAVEKKGKKKNKKILVVVIILGILVLAIGGYLVYDKCIKKDSNVADKDKTNTDNKKDDDNKTTEDDKKVDSIDFTWSRATRDLLDDTAKYYNYVVNLFNKDKLTINDMRYEDKLAIITGLLVDKYGKEVKDDHDAQSQWKNLTLTQEDFTKIYKGMFGETPDYTRERISLYSLGLDDDVNAVVTPLEYNGEKPKVEKIDITSYVDFYDGNVNIHRLDCCADRSMYVNDRMPILLVEKEEKGDGLLNIYVKPAYHLSDKFYKDSKLTEEIGKFTGNSNTTMKDYAETLKDKLVDTFKIVYKKNSDDNYYFYSIEKTKAVETTPTPTPTPKPVVKEIDKDSALVQGLLGDITAGDVVYERSCDAFTFYEKDLVTVKSLSEDSKIKIVVLKLTVPGQSVTVTKATFLDAYYKMFGEEYTSNMNAVGKAPNVHTMYANGDFIIDADGIGDLLQRSKITNIYKAEQSNDEIYIYEKPIFAEVTNAGIKEEIFYNCNYSKSLKKFYRDDDNNSYNMASFSEVLADVKADKELLDKLPEYKFTFKKNNDNSYRFVKSEKIK